MAVREVTNPMPGLKFYGAGAPTDNETFVGVAPKGATYKDRTSGKLYICTASAATTITWVAVGDQAAE